MYFVGPALAGVRNRWADKKDLYAFIHNPQAVIERNAYAKEVYEKWSRAYMQPFPDLSEKEIDLILDYCDQ